MAANYLPYDPQQMMLLPEALQERLPEGHLAQFIGAAVDGLGDAVVAEHERLPKRSRSRMEECLSSTWLRSITSQH